MGACCTTSRASSCSARGPRSPSSASCRKRELDLRDEEFEPPLRVLLVTARPEGAGFVDPRAIARELLDEIEGRGPGGADLIELEFLRPPTLAALRARLEKPGRPVHVLHFDGHGVCRDGRGHLAFEDEAGGVDLVEAAALAQVLQGSGVRLAVLTACQSAMGAPDDPSSSVAGQLLRGGVDAMAAMGASVLVAAAARYAESFYRALVPRRAGVLGAREGAAGPPR